MRKAMPVVRRVHEYTLKMRSLYTRAIYEDPAATLDDLREAVNMLEDAGRTARRVLGGAHPITTGIERRLRDARAALLRDENARLTGEVSKLRRALRHAANMIDALGGAPSGDVGVDS